MVLGICSFCICYLGGSVLGKRVLSTLLAPHGESPVLRHRAGSDPGSDRHQERHQERRQEHVGLEGACSQKGSVPSHL